MHEISVCLIEDSDADATLIELLAREGKIANDFLRFTDGESALAYLLDEANPLPDLVLLDQNLPGISGADVLTAIRTTQRLAQLRVFILIGSETLNPDVSDHADGAVTKPIGMAGFLQIVQSLDEFWISVVSSGDDSHT